MFILYSNIKVNLHSLFSNSILQYWFYGMSIKILVVNLQKWGVGLCWLGAKKCWFRQTNTLYNKFSHIFCEMFLIDAIKPNLKKKFLTWVVSLQNKTSFGSFCSRFVGGNKNIIQKKREMIFFLVLDYFTTYCFLFKYLWSHLLKIFEG